MKEEEKYYIIEINPGTYLKHYTRYGGTLSVTFELKHARRYKTLKSDQKAYKALEKFSGCSYDEGMRIAEVTVTLSRLD